MKKIWDYGTSTQNNAVMVAYGKDRLNSKYKPVYNDDTIGMYIKDGKSIVVLSEDEQNYIKENYQ